MKSLTTKLITALAVALLVVSAASAANVDLATVPPRASVQLTIYNSEDLTLVRETRSLSLKKGVNRIQYSWAGTLIDPTSVEIRPIDNEDSIEVLDTTFPGSKPQHLIWNIDSKIEGEVEFQVTYFTSGISWRADYVLVADKNETSLDLDGYVEIINNSGEDYENAQVRLVVGVVNLVEKIADLARRGLVSPHVLEGKDEREMLRAKGMVLMEAADRAGRGMSFDAVANAPAEIIKEGLSEYFIYTVDGAQTVSNGWSKRMISIRAREVEFDIVYRLRDYQYGPRPVRFFLLRNDEEHRLGTTPMPDGRVRTFRDNGREGLAFLGEQHVNYVPIKDMIELNVGWDDEVVEEAKVASVERANFTYDRNQRVNGYDETRSIVEQIRNYKDKPIRIEIRRVIDGDVDLSAEGARLHDYRTVESTLDIKPRETCDQTYSYTQHMGSRHRQSRIRLN